MQGPNPNMSMPQSNGMSMGDWLLTMLPDYFARQGLSPEDIKNPPQPDANLPTATANGATSATAPQAQIAQTQPVPAAQPANAGSYFSDIASAVKSTPAASVNNGSYFSDIPSAVQASASAAEEAQAKKAAESPIGKALSGIQALQPQGIDNPGAPGVPGTRQVDARLAEIIKALTQGTQGKTQLSGYIR